MYCYKKNTAVSPCTSYIHPRCQPPCWSYQTTSQALLQLVNETLKGDGAQETQRPGVCLRVYVDGGEGWGLLVGIGAEEMHDSYREGKGVYNLASHTVALMQLLGGGSVRNNVIVCRGVRVQLITGYIFHKQELHGYNASIK